MTVREIDVFYAQRHLPELGWNTGYQSLNFTDACANLRSGYKAGELKRIVRYRHSDVIGVPSCLVVLWQGKKVPDWLGELARDNT